MPPTHFLHATREQYQSTLPALEGVLRAGDLGRSNVLHCVSVADGHLELIVWCLPDCSRQKSVLLRIQGSQSFDCNSSTRWKGSHDAVRSVVHEVSENPPAWPGTIVLLQ